jgi:hypothetical protein
MQFYGTRIRLIGLVLKVSRLFYIEALSSWLYFKKVRSPDGNIEFEVIGGSNKYHTKLS